MIDGHIGSSGTGTTYPAVVNSRDLGTGGTVGGIVVIIVISRVGSVQGHMPKIIPCSRLIPHKCMVASIPLSYNKQSDFAHGIGRNIQGDLEVIRIEIDTRIEIQRSVSGVLGGSISHH